MFKFVDRTKGAISVFLVIIMLPMMLLSWLMIDSARIKLAKARVVNATDLTLNAALSNYDNILKDMYGLFAMSQNKEELFANLDEYYTKNLMIAGLDDDTASYLSTNIIKWMDSLDDPYADPEFPYADFIKPVEDSFGVQRYYTSSLANPEIMKDQVVNFMKYRAPLGVGLKLLDLIQSFKTVDEQAQVVEDKTAYYEAQSSLEEKLRTAWGNIEKYIDLYNNEFDTKMENKKGLLSKKGIEKIEALMDKSNEYSNGEGWEPQHILKENITNVIVNQLLMTSPYDTNGSNNVIDWEFVYFYKFPFNISVDGEKYTVVYDKEYVIDFAVPNNNSDNNNSNGGNSNNNNGNNTDNNGNNTDNNGNNEQNNAPLLPNETDKARLNTLAESYYYQSDCAILKLYNDGLENYSSGNDNDLSSLIGQLYRELDLHNSGNITWQDEIKEFVNILSKGTNALSDTEKTNYKNVLDFYKNLSEKINNAYENRTKVQQAFRSTSSVNYYFMSFAKKMNKFHEVLTDAEKYLGNASGKLQDAYNYLTETLNPKKETWRTSSKTSKISGSEFSKDNLKEIDTLDGKFKPEDIQYLKKIVDAKKQTITKIREKIESIKFNGHSIYLMTNLYDFYNYLPDNLKNIAKEKWKYNKSLLKNEFYNEIFVLFENFELGIIDYNKIVKEVASQPQNQSLNCEIEFVNINSPLFNDMNKKYHGAGGLVKDDGSLDDSGNTAKEGEKKNNAKNTAKSVSDEDIAKNKNENSDKGYSPGKPSFDDKAPSKVNLNDLDRKENKSNTGSVDGPTFGDMDGVGKASDSDDFKDSTKAVSGAGEKTKGFFKELFDALEHIGEKLRDTLYIEEYIMGMFSYRTIEKETFVDIYSSGIGESVVNEFKYTGFHLYGSDGKKLTSGFGIASTPDKFDAAKVIEKLETLTNVPISPELNKYYLGEVEYIIYGENGTGDVETTIFAIRFILNVISAFMNSELNSIARSIALAIFGYPPLTFLVPIAQIAIIIACAIGESFIDKALILGGFKVPVFKSSENWIVSPTGIANSAKDFLLEESKHLVKKGIEKAASKIDEAIDGLNKQADTGIDYASDKVKNDLGDCLSGAYDETIGGYVDDVTDTVLKLIDMYKEEYCQATEGDFKLEDAKKYVSKKIKDNLSSFIGLDSGKGDLINKVKQYAVNLIVEKSSSYLDPMIVEVLTPLQTGQAVQLTDNKVENSKIVAIPMQIKQTILDAVNGSAGSGVDSIVGEIKKMKNDAIDTVKNALDEGVEKFEEAASDFIDEISDNVPGLDDDSVATDSGKAFSLGYSGYLRIFLLIAILCNEDGVMKRMGDIIQANMQMSNPNFELYKSYTYIDINVNAEVKPLFFSFDGLNRLLKEYGGEGIEIGKMYKINYSERSGY